MTGSGVRPPLPGDDHVVAARVDPAGVDRGNSVILQPLLDLDVTRAVDDRVLGDEATIFEAPRYQGMESAVRQQNWSELA